METRGRTSTNPEDYIVSCRIQAQEMQLLQSIAQQSKTGITDLLRHSLRLLQQEFVKMA